MALSESLYSILNPPPIIIQLKVIQDTKIGITHFSLSLQVLSGPHVACQLQERARLYHSGAGAHRSTCQVAKSKVCFLMTPKSLPELTGTKWECNLCTTPEDVAERFPLHNWSSFPHHIPFFKAGSQHLRGEVKKSSSCTTENIKGTTVWHCYL